MKLPESFTTVTTFSKILAIFLFVTLPFLGFYLGYQYKKSTVVVIDSKEALTEPQKKPVASPTMSTSEFLITNSDSNLGWKTLTHELGFSFDFPSGKNYSFENGPTNPSTDELLYFRIYTDTEGVYGGPFIEVFVSNDNEALNYSSEFFEAEPKNVNIKGNIFKEYTVLGLGSPHVFLIIKNNLTYAFHEVFGPLPEFTKLVDSIKFQ